MSRIGTAALTLVVALALPACGMGGFVEGLIGEQKRDIPPGTEMSPDERAMALEVTALVNEIRAAEGLEPLVWDEAAADCAYDHCVDMRVRNYYGHVSPDGVGAEERMVRGRVDYAFYGGENIARGEDSPRQVVGSWMGSPHHRDAILAPGFTHMGVGVQVGRKGPWWTQEFLVRYD